MRYRLRKIRKPQIFAILMAVSAVLVLLPRDSIGPLRNLVHLASYLPQLAATRSAQAVSGRIKDSEPVAVSSGEQEKIRLDNLTLSNENVALQQKVAELTATVSSLGNLRKGGLREGVLVPASVIGFDAADGRESLCLGKGKLSNINKNDWVASRLFIQAGTEEGVQSQAAILAHECLIGWVEEACQVTARVVLLTDPVANRNMSVRIWPRDARRRLWENGKDVTFPLEGAGNGHMRILDVFRDYVEKKQILEGDWVVCQPSPRLPLSLVIGRIESFEHVLTKPVYYRANVAPLFDPKSLEQVFVVDLSRSPAGRSGG